MKTLEIHDAGKKNYEIYMEQSFDTLPEKLQDIGVSGRKLCIITDSHVAPIYLNEVVNLCSGIASKVVSFTFEAGEAHKSLNVIEKIYEKLIIEKFDRNDFLLALGGGVTGDMTGYAAATYLRGISFIQVPTTLLAQVDSSIGGKTGVDFLQYKNMVGAFHQPALVYMNLNTLKTLDNRELSAGMAEVIKHGLIKNKEYYHWIQKHINEIFQRDYTTLETMIYESCKIKGEVVENDPKEHGERVLLNFGHTIGHAVEKLMDFQWLHGECVALGCVAAAKLSMDRAWIKKEDYIDICSTFESFNLPVDIKNIDLDSKKILEATKSDKKMDGGKVKFILLKSIGNACIYKNLSDEEILEGIGVCL